MHWVARHSLTLITMSPLVPANIISCCSLGLSDQVYLFDIFHILACAASTRLHDKGRDVYNYPGLEYPDVKRAWHGLRALC